MVSPQDQDTYFLFIKARLIADDAKVILYPRSGSFVETENQVLSNLEPGCEGPAYLL